MKEGVLAMEDTDAQTVLVLEPGITRAMMRLRNEYGKAPQEQKPRGRRK